MIISHEHKFIFLHCRKVAGSTITTLCNPYLGPADLQTGAWPDTIAAGGKFNREALKIAFRHPGYLLKKSYRYSVKNRTARLSPNTVNKLVQSHLVGLGLPGGAHPKASQVRQFDEASWRDYFKFCFVRNPWDHAVSDFYWRSRASHRQNVGFKEFLRRLGDPDRPDPEGIVPPLRSNWEIYAIDNKVSADFVGRFESLECDLRQAGKTIGIDLELGSVSPAKGSIRRRDRSIADHYDDEAIELVSRIYANEISEFGYRPEFAI